MRVFRRPIFSLPLAVIVSILGLPAVHGWESSRVVRDSEGRLTYPADAEGNRIPDFSHAGYQGGGVPLPDIPVVRTLAPVAGDNTARLQAALDEVGQLPVQANGYRGTLLLSAGVYEVAGTLRMNRDGVVLAGVGDRDDPSANTLIRRTGTSTANVITAGGGNDDAWRSEIPGSRSQITTPFVPVGSRNFEVDTPALYRVGDEIIIWHPSTQAWIDAVDRGGVTDGNFWRPGEIEIRFHRYITAISGNTLTVDAPVFNHLDRSLSQSLVYKYDRTGMVTHLGIEDLQIHIVTAGPEAETHAQNAVVFIETENSWIRDCTVKHFVAAGVDFRASTRGTAERVRALEPHSLVTGSRRYNFNVYRSQLILFRDCYASLARHAYIANGTSLDSGIVFLDCVTDRPLGASEGHRRWSLGLLFDNLTTLNPENSLPLALYNRGTYGTGHGWGAAHSVAWRCDVAGRNLIVQKPPTAQNYAIGCFGNVTGSGPFAGSAGFIEGSNTDGLLPRSLYLEQLAQRLATDTGPRFNPAGGSYASTQAVTLSTSGDGYLIRYTTDGTTPTPTAGTLYAGPITVSSTTTLRAIAYRDGAANGTLASATYSFAAPPPPPPVTPPAPPAPSGGGSGGGSWDQFGSLLLVLLFAAKIARRGPRFHA
jgi:hypothetical protein